MTGIQPFFLNFKEKMEPNFPQDCGAGELNRRSLFFRIINEILNRIFTHVI